MNGLFGLGPISCLLLVNGDTGSVKQEEGGGRPVVEVNLLGSV